MEVQPMECDNRDVFEVCDRLRATLRELLTLDPANGATKAMLAWDEIKKEIAETSVRVRHLRAV